MKKKTIYQTACILALISVALGAFAAHGLKELLPIERLDSFQTGVRYQFYHTFALFIIALTSEHKHSVWLKRAALVFTIGIVLFSGSIYLLACRDILGIASWTWLGPITPIGGLLFMLGWLFLLFTFFK